MATATRAKPKKAAAKPAPAKKAPSKKAKKASTTAAKPAKTANEVTYTERDFVEFLGYKSNIGEDAVFSEGDNLIIVEVIDDEERGLLLGAVKASDYADFLEDPEAIEGGEVAPSEIKHIKGSALTEIRERYLPIVNVGDMEKILEDHDGNLIDTAKDLNERAQESYFYLGGVLAKILQEGSYLKENGGKYEGDEAFNDFCEENFGFNHHKARDLARIYTTFSVIPEFTPDMLKNVGWSKARAIQRYVTPENMEEVISTAEDTTQRDLGLVLKETYASADNKTPSGASASRGTIKKTTMTFRLMEEGATGVRMTLEEVMKEKGLKDEAEALEHVVMTYASEHLGSPTKQKRVVAKLNKSAKARGKTDKPVKDAA